MSAGYFDDHSMLRCIHRERAVALSGPRALLMQAAHPVAVKGLLAHTDALQDPYDRLARTAKVMSTIGFGSRAEADRMTRRVRALHRHYGVDDPELLLWVLFTLVDSALVVYQRYVRQLSREEQAAYWEDFKVIGRLFGLRAGEMPPTLDELDAYRRRMLEGDELRVTDWAREHARRIVLEPPVPWVARPLLETVNFVTIALLPDRIREQYGFSPLPPAVVRKALVAGGAEYVKRAVIPVLPDKLRFVGVSGGQAAA
jgi:uncharacterized protein (DUF2236 family)